ncbi:RDD family protein [Helicobacter turcicus]|uniref:RDD family protein n=1 Tax=Helicobacter turcicus TaxID=2867412 RepID=A0ABS7JP82_9HELI|nr:RDD family protein [Helicobacter turcicus]MBX7491179.1 RDD family protein [Helicobacter turcicus]MBX7546046.1 RDD family protein [Helicobacter turcicus]
MNPEKIEEILAREEIQTAALWKRVVAHIIDDLLVSMVIIGMYWESITQNVGDPEVVLNAISSSWLILYVVRIVYHWLFVRYYGATIGKIVVKIKVIETELLDNPNIRQAFVRSLFRALSEFLMYLPFLSVLMNSLQLGLHDRVANTIVVELKSYNV